MLAVSYSLVRHDFVYKNLWLSRHLRSLLFPFLLFFKFVFLNPWANCLCWPGLYHLLWCSGRQLFYISFLIIKRKTSLLVNSGVLWVRLKFDTFLALTWVSETHPHTAIEACPLDYSSIIAASSLPSHQRNIGEFTGEHRRAMSIFVFYATSTLRLANVFEASEWREIGLAADSIEEREACRRSRRCRRFRWKAIHLPRKWRVRVRENIARWGESPRGWCRLGNEASRSQTYRSGRMFEGQVFARGQALADVTWTWCGFHDSGKQWDWFGF